MNDLLQVAVDAHGGLSLWNQFRSTSRFSDAIELRRTPLPFESNDLRGADAVEHNPRL